MGEGGWKEFFGGDTARVLGETIIDVYPSFDLSGFIEEVSAGVKGLELTPRVRLMTEAMRKRLPPRYVDALAILVESLGPELKEGEGSFTHGWFLMPVARFVQEYGLDDPEASLNAMYEITRRHTSEYAIRPYITQHPDLTFAKLHEWVRDPSFNVRRWVSEGIRPRLPWASKIDRFIQDPQPVLDILEVLRDDPSNYVQKSVANNLNDIAKDHADLVIEIAERWADESPSANTMWILKHGLRTLVKNGDPRALAILGASGSKHLALDDFTIDAPAVAMGDALGFAFTVRNRDKQAHQVSIDYIVHFLRGKGKRNAKVFKLTTLTLPPGGQQTLSRSHTFKYTRVRRYYPGLHKLDIQVNGRVLGEIEFELQPPLTELVEA